MRAAQLYALALLILLECSPALLVASVPIAGEQAVGPLDPVARRWTAPR